MPPGLLSSSGLGIPVICIGSQRKRPCSGIKVPCRERVSAMSAIITPERPDSADAVGLIAELDAHLEPLSPRESRHGYSVAKLIAQEVAFFVLRNNNTPAGCGGIQLFGTAYGQLKRMYVRPQFRGLGFGRLLLNHL